MLWAPEERWSCQGPLRCIHTPIWGYIVAVLFLRKRTSNSVCSVGVPFRVAFGWPPRLVQPIACKPPCAACSSWSQARLKLFLACEASSMPAVRCTAPDQKEADHLQHGTP